MWRFYFWFWNSSSILRIEINSPLGNVECESPEKMSMASFTAKEWLEHGQTIVENVWKIIEHVDCSVLFESRKLYYFFFSNSSVQSIAVNSARTHTYQFDCKTMNVVHQITVSLISNCLFKTSLFLLFTLERRSSKSGDSDGANGKIYTDDTPTPGFH